MKRIITVLIVLLSISANAQLFSKLKSKLKESISSSVERKVEKEIDKEIDKQVDKEVDKQIDKIVNSSEEEPIDEVKKEKRSINLENLGITTGPAINKVYTFNTQLYIEYNDGGDNMMQQILISDDGYSGMKTDANDGSSIFITDNESSLILTETDGMKIQINTEAGSTQSNFMQKYIEQSQDESNFTKTGKTKNILGYKCYEYLVDFEETKATCWISPSLEFKNSIYVTVYGTVLEYSNTINGDEVTSKVTKITNKTIKIDAGEYKSMSNLF